MKRQNNILDDQQTVGLLQNIRKCLPEEMLVQINERYEKANTAGNHYFNCSYKGSFALQCNGLFTLNVCVCIAINTKLNANVDVEASAEDKCKQSLRKK